MYLKIYTYNKQTVFQKLLIYEYYSLNKNMASKKLIPASIPPKKKKFEMADNIVKGLVISATKRLSLDLLRLPCNYKIQN